MGQVIIDFDGTLTAEESQAALLAERSLDTLSTEILGVPRASLLQEYATTRARLLANPDRYWWEVNGLIASYCDEGAFILNTTTLQVMLRENPVYRAAVEDRFRQAEYDPVVDCTNYLFHRHTAELAPAFREDARDVLVALLGSTDWVPVVLTNSMGDKVQRQLSTLDLPGIIKVMGDTRQYEMAPAWQPQAGAGYPCLPRTWVISERRRIDLLRPAYYAALVASGPNLVVVADTLSLPGAVPLAMGIPFCLVCTPYTPSWCAEAVAAHPCGYVLHSLRQVLHLLPRLASGDGISPKPRQSGEK